MSEFAPLDTEQVLPSPTTEQHEAVRKRCKTGWILALLGIPIWLLLDTLYGMPMGGTWLFGFGFDISFAYGMTNLFWSIQPALYFLMFAAIYRWIAVRAAHPLSLFVVIGQWLSLMLLAFFLWLIAMAIGDLIDPWPMNIGGKPNLIWGLGWQSSMRLGLTLAGIILVFHLTWAVALLRAFRKPKP